jgi:hypothetical protein
MEPGFISQIYLDEKPYYFKELKVKHLKIIYKCLLGDDLEPSPVFANITPILAYLTNNDINTINQLSFINYFKLLFEIRCNSIGNLIFVELTDTINTKVEINIYKFIEILNEIDLRDLLKEYSYENFSFSLRLPSILDLQQFPETPTLENLYKFFIKEIKIKGKTISLLQLNSQEKEEILELIPAKTTSIIVNKVQEVLGKFNDVNLLSKTYGLQDKKLPFNLNIRNLTSIIKVLFGEQLLPLYENIFGLCKVGNFTPEYIEDCTPGEYLLFVKKLEAMNQQDSQQQNTEGDYDPMTEQG